MKKHLCILLINAVCGVAHSQGTVFFSNGSPGGMIDAPVFQSDGVRPLSGPQFMAELLIGKSPAVLISVATTGFLTGTGAGFFTGGVLTINSIVPGTTASVQVDVWNKASGASFGQA